MKIDDSPHILCVNPWIHDFAAYDFWAKPLGLLYIASILRERGFNISYIDCLDRFHPKERAVKVLWDGRGPFRKIRIPPPEDLAGINRRFSRYGIEVDWFVRDLKRIKKPDIVFVTCSMTYWATGVRETIGMIKKIYPGVPVVLGGIYPSLCYEHAKANSMADLVVKGRGENKLRKIIRYFTGIDIGLCSDDIDALPFPAFDLQSNIAYSPILTSRGCPFSCQYCASSFLEPELRRRSFRNVFKEIEHWHFKHKVKNFVFYDDALLIESERHIFPLLDKIISSDVNAWFHTPNALHVREIKKKTARLMYKAGFKTIRLGLETTDSSFNRDKVKGDDFFKAVENLKNAGFESNQIGAYLLCGLPGQNLDKIESSVRTVKKTGILPVLAYYTPIPHTEMWEKAVKHSRFDIRKDPVFTNNTLFPCINSEADLKRISQLKNI